MVSLYIHTKLLNLKLARLVAFRADFKAPKLFKGLKGINLKPNGYDTFRGIEHISVRKAIKVFSCYLIANN